MSDPALAAALWAARLLAGDRVSAIKDLVECSGGAYAIAYGTDENGAIVDIQLFARRDAAEALEPILREFEARWQEGE